MNLQMSPAERARKNETVILQALAAAGQNNVALALGVNESTISRFKDGGLAQAAAILAHCGLKVIGSGMQCFDPAYVDALKTLAGIGLQKDSPKLDWSESA